jgi:hypothetical protein
MDKGKKDKKKTTAALKAGSVSMKSCEKKKKKYD